MSRRNVDDEFDLRAQAELSFAYEPGEAPGHLLRHTRWIARRGVQASLIVLVLAAVVGSVVLALRPQALVREAIEHEYYERTLRGSFMDSATLLRHMGMDPGRKVPGYPQLMRPCEIGGMLAFHLTTFFEKGGIVTVFSFDKPVRLEEGSGWWNDVYWQVLTGHDGRQLVLVSEKKRALSVAQTVFAKSPA